MTGELRKPGGEAVRGGEGRAAVVAIFTLESGEPELLFVVRKISEEDAWSGQVAFPGGKWKPGDSDILATAKRELWEETGLRLGEDAEILGLLRDVRPLNMPSLLVTPFLAKAEEKPEVRLGEELSTYFWARVSSLERTQKISRKPDGSLCIVPAFRYSAWVIWGMTSRILEQIIPILRDISNFSKHSLGNSNNF